MTQAIVRFELLPVFLPCVDLEISERVGGVQNYFRSPQVHAMVIFSALSKWFCSFLVNRGKSRTNRINNVKRQNWYQERVFHTCHSGFFVCWEHEWKEYSFFILLTTFTRVLDIFYHREK